MKRFLSGLILLAFLALAASPAGAGSVTLLGAGKSTAAASYQGPGDQVTFLAFWGTRAYTSATRGAKLLNVCDSTGGTDVACADVFSSATTGAIVPKTIGGITCPGNANCTVKTAYDISGNSNCSANPCDVTQATVASRPTLSTAACNGGKDCLVCSGTQFLASVSSRTLSQPQPYMVSYVAKRTSGTGFTNVLGAGPQTGMSNSADTWLMFAGTVRSGTAADNTFHSLQATYNGASSTLYLDGGSVAVGGSPGAVAFDDSAKFPVLCAATTVPGSTLTGQIFETGVAAGSGLNDTGLDANQRSYYGL